MREASFDRSGRGREARKPDRAQQKELVVSSYRLFIPNGFDNRWLETTRG
jgi:hypothetical protein